MMIELSDEDVGYLTVLVRDDLDNDRAQGRNRTADRHFPLWAKLQRAAAAEAAEGS